MSVWWRPQACGVPSLHVKSPQDCSLLTYQAQVWLLPTHMYIWEVPIGLKILCSDSVELRKTYVYQLVIPYSALEDSNWMGRRVELP